MTTIVPGWCSSYIGELVSGGHDLRNDVLKLALYPEGKDLDFKTVTTYDSDGEIEGSGYVAGGALVTLGNVNPRVGMVAMAFEDMIFDRVKLAPRSAILYNNTNGDAAIAVLDLLNGKVVNGELRIVLNVYQPFAGFVEVIE